MIRVLLTILLSLTAMCAMASDGVVKGKILDKTTNEALGFVNVRVTRRNSTELVKGDVTDIDGNFSITGLPVGDYTLSVTYMGYKDVKRDFAISPQHQAVSYASLYLAEDSKTLKEVTVTGQRSSMKLEVDRKSFDVSSMISNVGESASDALENIPSVEVDNDGNVSLRGDTSVEVWINGKSSGLTSDNRAQILEQLPAESIERIEVIDNPSAKFSAEGSVGIINIVLKKDRKAGYYGSLQAGGNTRGGANSSFNINYNSSLIDAYFNIGYRHRSTGGRSESQQDYLNTNEYQRYAADNDRMGNNVFTRAGLTWHATEKDDFSLSGMMMMGRNKSWSLTPYDYGSYITGPLYLMTRDNRSRGNSRMFYGEFNYRHNFTDNHFIDFTVDFNRWKSDNDNYYRDSTTYYNDAPTEYDYQYRPSHMNNRRWEVKLDYENQLTDNIRLQAGYQGEFFHENTPQESWIDEYSFEGDNPVEDKEYFNRFIYDLDIHSLYATASFQIGKLGIMPGLRGEYWRVNTESYSWEQEHDPSLRDAPFKKDYFQLFPSLFLNYQLPNDQQIQVNYTRRLRRPWGGQLNSFRNTSDASMISYGNPELTPEFSNSFSLNYLKTWTEHSLLVSAYYRPTSDVMQRINYQSSADGNMYSTTFNVGNSLSTGVEATLKNRLFRILDLTSNVNAYYYKLDDFSFDIDGQTIMGEPSDNFTWNARVMASVILPWDITVQTSGRYRSRRTTAQGYRKGNFSMDLGLRKSFLDRTLMLSINCRDLLNSRKFENFSSSETFTRHQMHTHGGRRVNITLTWNFGNMTGKKAQEERPGGGEDMFNHSSED